MNCTIGVAKKKKALISFAVTAKLICVFLFAYVDCWFSHEAAHLLYTSMEQCLFVSDLEFSVDHKILLLKLTILSSETIDLISQK